MSLLHLNDHRGTTGKNIEEETTKSETARFVCRSKSEPVNRSRHPFWSTRAIDIFLRTDRCSWLLCMNSIKNVLCIYRKTKTLQTNKWKCQASFKSQWKIMWQNGNCLTKSKCRLTVWNVCLIATHVDRISVESLRFSLCFVLFCFVSALDGSYGENCNATFVSEI